RPAPSRAAPRPAPRSRAAAQTAQTASTPSTTATPRATYQERPSSSMGAPYTQKGKGNQLVPLGSRDGSRANCCAMVTRAKSSSLTAVTPLAIIQPETSSLRAASASRSSAVLARGCSPLRTAPTVSLVGRGGGGLRGQRLGSLLLRARPLLQGVGRSPREVGEGEARDEEHGPDDPRRLGEDVAGAASSEHLRCRRAGEGTDAAALSWLEQDDQDQKQA